MKVIRGGPELGNRDMQCKSEKLPLLQNSRTVLCMRALEVKSELNSLQKKKY